MPLSEHEERALEEIARRLSEEDPKFVATVSRRSSNRVQLVRLRWAAVSFVVGLVLLLGITFHLAFGVVGVVLMLVGVVLGVEALRGLGPAAAGLGAELRRTVTRRDRSDDGNAGR